MAARKKTEAAGASFPRRTSAREPKLVAWIFCEGAQTERLYFEALRASHHLFGVKIKAIGADSLGVVEAAEKFFRENRPDSETWDDIWCVFDRDNTGADRFNKALATAERFNQERLEEAGCSSREQPHSRPMMYIAHSNPCFELWYRLHYHYLDTPTTCADCCNKLGGELGMQYRKNLSDMYHRLEERLPDAIRNAKQLHKLNDPPSPAKDNPSTTVHLLVEKLITLRRR